MTIKYKPTIHHRRSIRLKNYDYSQAGAYFVTLCAQNRAPQPTDRAPQPDRAWLTRAPKSLGSFIAGFKSAATKRINELRDASGAILWQRNYYEHIVRNEKELQRIRDYISANPSHWT